MTILVDTSVLIDHLRGDIRARSALASAAARGEHLTGSVVTRVELLAGMRSGEERAIDRLLATMDWFAVDLPIADHAGALANRYLRSHPGVDPVDFIIAATAELLGAELWTLNVKHFPMFDRLAPPYEPRPTA